jgi:hypothetical protein
LHSTSRLPSSDADNQQSERTRQHIDEETSDCRVRNASSCARSRAEKAPWFFYIHRHKASGEIRASCTILQKITRREHRDRSA